VFTAAAPANRRAEEAVRDLAPAMMREKISSGVAAVKDTTLVTPVVDYRDGTGGSFSSPGLLWTPRIFSARETIR